LAEIVRVFEPGSEGLFALLDRYLAEIGESVLDDDGRRRISEAMLGDRIRFFAALEAGAPIGICSLTLAWSTFAGGAPIGMLEDFYVLPEYRHRGVARSLVDRILAEARAEGCSSVVVGCTDSDEAMYRALGFTQRLGSLLSSVLPSR
jgi:GNAT superfamily N-acetyltransferase